MREQGQDVYMDRSNDVKRSDNVKIQPSEYQSQKKLQGNRAEVVATDRAEL